jgi:CDP-glucose 4,6-dehydratase
MGGYDPYSSSKGCAELISSAYRKSFFQQEGVAIATARAGNVIGGGDYSLDRIVPDCIRAIRQNNPIELRNPQSTRPWQHVLEPLSGYLVLASNIANDGERQGEAYNFGPSADQNYPVSELINEMSKYWDQVKWNDISGDKDHMHEAGLLKLNCDKALFDLDWHSTLQFDETIQMTVEWYKTYYKECDNSMHDFSIDQIEFYTRLAKSNKASLTKPYLFCSAITTTLGRNFFACLINKSELVLAVNTSTSNKSLCAPITSNA